MSAEHLAVGDYVRLKNGTLTGRIVARAWDTYMCQVSWGAPGSGDGQGNVHEMYLERVAEPSPWWPSDA